ncbi:hypothetical protein [Streptomyces sp. NPDC087300]|uniref:hypothetical protein n=1 Tax=Streptomyces sp. NPDC087300 TaxID=3365780 RepID=UPI003807A30E
MTTPPLMPVSFRIAAALVECVRANLACHGMVPCTTTVRHSVDDQVPMYWCAPSCECEGGGSGHLYARVASVDSPQAASETRPGRPVTGGCHADTVVQVDVGIHRCTSAHNTPDMKPELVTDQARQLLVDEQIMRAALHPSNCTGLPAKWTAVAGLWTPSGPAGGCAGGQIRVTAAGRLWLHDFGQRRVVRDDG